MKISIDFDGIQEGKQYNFSFCLSSDGQVVIQKAPEETPENDGPSLGDFENKETPSGPSLEDFKEKTKRGPIEFESSFDGKLEPGESV